MSLVSFEVLTNSPPHYLATSLIRHFTSSLVHNYIMVRIQVGDLFFEPYLTEAQIRARVAEIGQALQERFVGERPVFLVMLKGATMFAMDLVRAFKGPCEFSFVRAKSYLGTSSSENVQILLAPDQKEVKGRHIIIVEDIVDSGRTMDRFLPLLAAEEPASITLVSLLLKPDMLEKEVHIDHVGFRIPPKFVVGYGLDYNGYGRNLGGIYQLAE